MTPATTPLQRSYWGLVVTLSIIALVLRLPGWLAPATISDLQFLHALPQRMHPLEAPNPFLKNSPLIQFAYGGITPSDSGLPIPLRILNLAANVGILPFMHAIGCVTIGPFASIIGVALFTAHPISIALAHDQTGLSLIFLLMTAATWAFLFFLGSSSPKNLWMGAALYGICLFAMGPWWALITVGMFAVTSLIMYWIHELTQQPSVPDKRFSSRALGLFIAFSILSVWLTITVNHAIDHPPPPSNSGVSLVRFPIPTPPNSIIGHAYFTLSKAFSVCVDPVDPNDLGMLNQIGGYTNFFGLVIAVILLGLYGPPPFSWWGFLGQFVILVIGPVILFDLTRIAKISYSPFLGAFALPSFLLLFGKGLHQIAEWIMQFFPWVTQRIKPLALALCLAAIPISKPYAVALSHYYKSTQRTPVVNSASWNPILKKAAEMAPKHPLVIFDSERTLFEAFHASSVHVSDLPMQWPIIIPPIGFTEGKIGTSTITVVPKLNGLMRYLAEQRQRPRGLLITKSSEEISQQIKTKFIGVATFTLVLEHEGLALYATTVR